MELEHRTRIAGAAATGAWVGASLRPWRAVRFARLHRSAPPAQHPDQHEPDRQSLGQCDGRSLHQDAEVRGGVSPGTPGSARSSGLDPALTRKVHNERQLHSALGYLPPAEFERSLGLSPEATTRLWTASSPGPRGTLSAEASGQSLTARREAPGGPPVASLLPNPCRIPLTPFRAGAK